jgi:hypothetical protein
LPVDRQKRLAVIETPNTPNGYAASNTTMARFEMGRQRKSKEGIDDREAPALAFALPNLMLPNIFHSMRFEPRGVGPCAQRCAERLTPLALQSFRGEVHLVSSGHLQ